MKENTIESRLQQVASDSIIKLIMEGNWLESSYSNRFKLPQEFITEIYESLNKELIILAIKKQIEEQIAEKVVNQIATEISSDIKSVLAIKERRDNIRYFVAKNLDELVKL